MTRGQYHIPNVTPPYRPAAPPAQTAKQKCEASGGTYHANYVIDGTLIGRPTCIPHFTPLACNAIGAATGGAAQKQIASLCGRHPGIGAACGVAGIAYAAWCNDVDFKGDLF
jgi:hypothetical protein